jgi:spermidine synthase
LAAVAAVWLGAGGLRGNAAEDPATEPHVLAQVQGRHGRLEVLEARGLRLLVCDDVVQTAVPAAGLRMVPGTLLRGRDYVELIPYYRPDTRRALLIGLGGGLHAQALRAYGVAVQAVDIEPAVVPLAEKYFGFRGFAGQVTIADGREFLAGSARRFDAVVLDTFLGASVPQQLYTKEAFALMAERLEPSGLLAVHLIARPQHPATQAVARTVASVFPRWAAIRSGFGDELQHLYLFASRTPLRLGSEQRLRLDAWGFTGDEFFEIETRGAPVLTDAQTNLGQLCRDLAAAHRQRSRQLLGR